jgi:hypothetical protein
MHDESLLYVSAPECNLQGNFTVVSHICLLSICEFYVTPWNMCVCDSSHEFAVRFVIYCILIGAFVGQYIEYRKMHCVSYIKLVNNEFEVYENGAVVMRSFTSRHCRMPLISSEDSASNEEKFKNCVFPTWSRLSCTSPWRSVEMSII